MMNVDNANQSAMSQKIAMMSSMSIGGIAQAELQTGEHGMIAQTGYDQEGNTFNITHVNTEKLPNLIDLGSLGFEIAPNVIPEPQSKKLSARGESQLVSQSDLAKSEKNVSDGVATPGL